MKSLKIKTLLIVNLCLLAFFAMANGSLDQLAASLSLKNSQAYSQKYITGGQPSVSDLKKLATAGVEVVINLRGKGEFLIFNEQQIVEQLGMKYISIPVSNAQDISTESITKFHQSLAFVEGKALVHCATGNRVGAFFALESHQFNNKSLEQAIQIGKQAGLTRLEKYVEKVIQSSQTIK